MIRTILLSAAATGLCIGSASAGQAAGKEDQKMMRLTAECTYVVQIAEANGAKLNNPSSLWSQLKATVAVKFGFDPAPYDAEARAKYKKRERVMGAQEAMQKLMSRARECDAQL